MRSRLVQLVGGLLQFTTLGRLSATAQPEATGVFVTIVCLDFFIPGFFMYKTMTVQRRLQVIMIFSVLLDLFYTCVFPYAMCYDVHDLTRDFSSEPVEVLQSPSS